MISHNTPKILLLAHDLSDAAIERRASMLRAGGAIVMVAGFRRVAETINTVAGCRATDFGQTFNSGFVQRSKSVLREVFHLNKHRALFADADIIIARNLEMLAIGVRGRSLCRQKPMLVYECLDIHRLMLNEGPVGMLLRTLEGWLSRRASALITSSPAFVSGYFNLHSRVKLPVRLIENKVLIASEHVNVAKPLPRKPGPPWIIGWFGIIRCRKSLHILAEVVRQSEGKLEVIIRGRPARDQIADFDEVIAATPGMRFMGSYKNPDDLESIYREAHFSWAIDMFEEGLNSSWLLPNRIYEGGAYGCVPIALGEVETGRFLKKLGVGLVTHDGLKAFLVKLAKTMTADDYTALENGVNAQPRSTWVNTREDCKDLVQYLAKLSPARGANV